MNTTDRLLDLLPVHVRTRDDAAGGLLRALLDAVAADLEVQERDLDELYASWFVETCPEWVVPYLADLVGVADLPPHLPDLGVGEAGAGPSRRAFVANTIAYRRRKGTPAAIEQVARDVTGWPARVVEHYRLLATTSHSRHVRLDRPATASLRGAALLDLVPPGVALGALDPLAHTSEARRIRSGRGRYGIPNVGVFLFPHLVHAFATLEDEVAWPPAAPVDGAWAVHPLGLPSPLFVPPATEPGIEHLADEEDLPVPLRPRRLLALLRAARAGLPVALPVAVRVDDGAPLPPERVRVCGLEDLAVVPGTDPPRPLPGWQVMVDARTGHVHAYHAPENGSGGLDGAAPAGVRVRHAYGALADVGAGLQDRSLSHPRVLAEQGYTGDAGRPDVRGQVAVEPGGTTTTLAEALTRAEEAWADPAESAAGGTFVVCLPDHEVHPGSLAVHVPAATRLVLVAATWRDRVVGGEILPRRVGVYGPDALRPVVDGDLTVTGAGGSAVVLDGLVIDGDVVVRAGDLGLLTLADCTVAGTVRVEAGAAEVNEDCQVDLVRTVVRAVDVAPTVPGLTVRDSVVDSRPGGGGDEAGRAVVGDGAHLRVTGSTVRGDVRVRTLDAGSAVLDGTVTVEHRQTGCVRYSYLGPGSRVPRRYRCVPAEDGGPASPPVYVFTRPGPPSYLALAPRCPSVIAEGGEGGSEMGVHHHLGRPLRVQAARRLLEPFVPVGVELGVLGG